MMELVCSFFGKPFTYFDGYVRKYCPECQDVGLPVLPSVDEQRMIIDQKHQQEAVRVNEAEAKTPALSLSADADEPFLNISGEDKARIAAQFADIPRSREAVNLIREIYGDTLDIPLPQAVKRITELAVEGRFATVAERSTNSVEEIAISVSEKRMSLYENYQYIKSEVSPDSMILLEVGNFYEMFGKDAEIASKLLELEIVYRDAPFTERTPMCGFPAWVLDSNIDLPVDVVYTDFQDAQQGQDGHNSMTALTVFNEGGTI